MTLNDRNATL